MTITLDMTLLAVLALIVSIAAFFAPRFLGIVVAFGLFAFAVYELFPEVRDWKIAEAVENIDLGDLSFNRSDPGVADPDAGRVAN